MGDMGLLRRRPRGWLPGHAFAVHHRSRGRGGVGSEGPEFETSRDLDVEWEIRVDGREPYRFSETRKAPVWVSGGRTGGGKSWYSVRLRREYGLMSSVALPCVVDPDNPHAIWIDWDAAYELHRPAWKDYTERAPERRAAERERLEREDAAVIARAEAQPVDADTSALTDVARLYALGITGSAAVVSATDTGRAAFGVPIWRFELELDGGRRVTMEQAVPPRSLELYRAGNKITVYSDPIDPDALALG